MGLAGLAAGCAGALPGVDFGTGQLPGNYAGPAGSAAAQDVLAHQDGGGISQPSVQPSAPSPTPTQPAPQPSKPAAAQPIGPQVTVVGRWAPVGSDAAVLRTSFTGTRIGLRFAGQRLTLSAADIPPYNLRQPDFRSWFSVEIDGVLQPKPLRIQRGSQQLTVAAELADGEHEVWLTRRAEASQSARTELSSPDPGAGGRLLPPPRAPARRIEVLGASIDTGYSADGPVQPCVASDADHNAAHSWPYLTGQLVGAGVHNLAVAGATLAFERDPGAPLATPLRVRDFFQRADWMDTQSRWDFAAAPMDVVFIDLGGADWDGTKPQGLAQTSNRQIFTQALDDLVAQVRSRYSGTQVYLVVHPFHGSERGPVLTAIMADVAKRSSALPLPGRVQVLSFEPIANFVMSCDFHPGLALAQQLAQAAAARLHADLGWPLTPPSVSEAGTGPSTSP